MKNKLSTSFFLILFVFAAAAPAFAWTSEPDAVYQQYVEEYQLQADGSVIFRHSHRLKLLTHFAFNRQYGETFIAYNPEFQKLTIHHSKTTMADGQVVTAPENAFNEVLPRFAKDAPAFNHLREMVVTHTGLEREAVIDLDYQIETRSGFMPGLMGEAILAQDSPVEELIFRLRVPAQTELNYKLFNSGREPEIRKEGAERIYEWKFQDVEAVSPDKMQPPAGRYSPWLLFSATRLIEETFSHISNQPAFEMNISPEMQKWLGEIQRRSIGDLETSLEIQNHISSNIATLSVPMVHTGYRLRPPVEVWRSSGGTPLEKAVLLCALLNSAGITANPSMIAPYLQFPVDVAPLPVFTDCAVLVTAGDPLPRLLPVDHIAVADLAEHYPAGVIAVIGRQMLDVYPIPETISEDNRAGLKANLKVTGEGGLAGDLLIGLTGKFNPDLKWRTNPAALEKLFHGAAAGGAIENLQTREMSRDVCSATAGVTFSEPFRRQGKYMFWKLPENPAGTAAWKLEAMPFGRSAALMIPFPMQETLEVSLELPDSINLITPPFNHKLETPVGQFHFSVQVQEKVVKIQKKLMLSEGIISAGTYPEWQQLWQRWMDAANEELVFKLK